MWQATEHTPRPPAPGPPATGLPEVADRYDHEGRALRGDVDRAQLSGLGRPGTRRLDEDIGIIEQARKRGTISRIADIELDTALAQVADREV